MLYKFYPTVFLQPDAPEAIEHRELVREDSEPMGKDFEVHRAIFSDRGSAIRRRKRSTFARLLRHSRGIVMEPRNYPLEKMKAHVLQCTE